MSKEQRMLMLLQWQNFLHSGSELDKNGDIEGDEFGFKTLNNPEKAVEI